MARQAANYATGTRTARLRLAARAKPYYQQVAPGVTLGYIRKHSGPGAWQVRELVDGRYRYRTIGTADDVRRADGRDVLTHGQALAFATKPAPTLAPAGGKLTVARALDAYLVSLAARSAHATEARQRSAKWIIPTLGAVRVDRITKTQIEAWQAGMVRDGDDEDRRRSQDTANRVLTILKASLNHCFADEANSIASDAAWRRARPFKGVAVARSDHFDAGQIRLLIAKAATFDRAFAALIEAGYLTGARYGELIALDVRDLDARRRTLHIRGGKTGARIVTLTAEAVAFLTRVAADRAPEAPLLPRADGKRWEKNQQVRLFKLASAQAGLPSSASFYSLRHSHISRAIEAGMALTLLAENCGTSLLMIERTYAKTLAATRRDSIEQAGPKLRRVR